MSFVVYLCGHGSWAPKNGYTSTPRGCSMNFMIHHAKTLPTMNMYALCKGEYENQDNPERKIPPLHQVPDMTWIADESRKIKQCEKNLKLNDSIEHGAVLAPNHFSWAKLRKTKKKKTTAEKRKTSLSEFFEAYQDQIEAWVSQYGEVQFVWSCCTELKMNKTAMGKTIGINAQEGPEKYALKSGDSVRVESLL